MIEEYIEKANEIYFLLKYNKDEYSKKDTLILLFHELMKIIVYGDLNDLVTYAHKVYELNIPVPLDDPIGSRIKAFILLYINEVIDYSLIKNDNEL